MMPVEIILNSDEEWKAERRKGIGASDAAAILGMSPYKTNVELWEEKVGLRIPEDISDKPAVEYGHAAEPYLRELFALDHPELQLWYDGPYKIIRNSEYPFIQASPDGELVEKSTGRIGGLEIKTTEIKNPRQWDEWKDQVPQHYYCQVIWQMISTGWEFVWLKAQIKWRTKDGQLRLDTREYLIERADVEDDIEFVLGAGIEFWQKIQTRTKPALKLPRI